MLLEYVNRYEDHPELDGQLPYPHVLVCRLTLDGNDVFHRMGNQYLPRNEFVDWMTQHGWWNPIQVKVLNIGSTNVLVLSFATAGDASLARLRWCNAQ